MKNIILKFIFYKKFFFLNPSFFFIYLKWKNFLNFDTLYDLFKLQLKPIATKNIYHEHIYFFNDQINNKVERPLFINGIMKVKNSPQVEFLKNHLNKPIKKIIKLNIYKFYSVKLKKINLFNNKIIRKKLTQKQILNKIDRIKKIYFSIKKNGYLQSKFSNCYPCLIKNGYNYLKKKNNQKISGYEIFVGHRRISSLVALGKKNITVIILGNL